MNMYYKPNVFQARQLLIKRSCRDPVMLEFITNIVCFFSNWAMVTNWLPGGSQSVSFSSTLTATGLSVDPVATVGF